MIPQNPRQDSTGRGTIGSMKVSGSIIAAVLAFTVGTVTGPGTAAADPSCSVVSTATQIEREKRPTGKGIRPHYRVVKATTTRCGSDYATVLDLGRWIPDRILSGPR